MSNKEIKQQIVEELISLHPSEWTPLSDTKNNSAFYVVKNTIQFTVNRVVNSFIAFKSTTISSDEIKKVDDLYMKLKSYFDATHTEDDLLEIYNKAFKK